MFIFCEPGRTSAPRPLVGCCADSGWAGNSERGPPPQVCAGNGTGISLLAGLWREHLRGQYRTCKTPRGLALGCRLRQHVERHLLQLGSYPAGRLFLVALKDTQNTGKADVVKRFGESKAEGAAGGTGIAL